MDRRAIARNRLCYHCASRGLTGAHAPSAALDAIATVAVASTPCRPDTGDSGAGREVGIQDILLD